MNVLVLNCGSSTVKFQVIETDRDMIEADRDRRLAGGLIERIGGQALLTFQADGKPRERLAEPVRDHRAAVDRILRWVVSPESGIEGITSIAAIHAVGHRVVHGGEAFKRSVRIDPSVVAGIEECMELAPLHNPANLKGIYAATELLGPGVPQVAVFDTSFHSTLPDVEYLYAIPYQLYRRHHVRRYGFHGTSHRYVAFRYRKLTGKKRNETNIITVHLGNGCSACAIKAGASVATSMGFTPLEGLMMGTRSGDVDPGILDYVGAKEGLSPHEVERMLYSQSGLLGVSGLTNDMRELLAEAQEHDDRRAKLAIELFAYRVRKYIGSYLAALGGAKAIVFAGGIGEHAAPVRAMICEGLEAFGIRLDPAANAAMVGGREGRISVDGDGPAVWVIPTDEELLIARDTFRVVNGLELPA